MTHSPTSGQRIEAVDALRGFAVMAILLVHNLEHFIYPVYPENLPSWAQALDDGVFTVIFALFAGKAYAIFALLFGLTFFIQSDRQHQLGRDFGPRFLWRLVLLAGFATLNAAFFPAGDVLQLFVVVGIVLFLVRNFSDRALLVTSVIFLLQPVEWIHYVVWLIDPAHTLPDLRVGEMYNEVAAYTRAGDFGDFVLGNITLGQKASLLWAVNAGRFVQTAGLFTLGLYLGRKGLFYTTEENARRWTAVLIAAAVAFAPLYALRESVADAPGPVPQTVGTALDMWQKLAFTLVLVSSFMLLWQKAAFRNRTSDLRFYGRMSLTNYVSQSVIGALIYFPFGLSLAPFCGYTLSLLIGVATFFAQVRFCRWWLASHRQGLLEALWHKWTWLGSSRRKSDAVKNQFR